MNNTVFNTISALALVFVLTACGGKSFKKNPMDEIIRDLPPDQVFSLLLHDMDVQGNFTETYYHKSRPATAQAERLAPVWDLEPTFAFHSWSDVLILVEP